MTYGADFGAGPGDARRGVARPASASRRARDAALLTAGWVGVLWLLEGIDVLSGHALDTFGITPREAGELRDVVPAAFLHFGFDHLAANSVPLLVMGFLAALSGIRRFLAVVAVIVLVSGLGVWLTAPAHSTTAGASGVVFGLFGYLVLRGFVDRRAGDVLLGVLVGAVYGSILWGVLPTTPGVSWQGHLFGLLGGVAAALVFRRPGRRP
ncbi:rhomboid family intramembrane serine protease [Streptomyces sp. DH24]|uniref:rhomboid family intramembrane serine protease n=1 Tax=Streptomyces sp. DH24 TaxID=3040123 RepID=UPI00244203E1|nr:rhomboid family intramembrane serine protease [Streptomyces sp. DH24]MDG9720253.1 rhomboid family intramembrane serine protease [Streptomyces sp. DH24]